MKKILLYASLATTALFAGCDLNINDDPNYPMNDQVTADLIFPSISASIASAMKYHQPLSVRYGLTSHVPHG